MVECLKKKNFITHRFIDVVDLGTMSGKEKSSRLTASQSCPLHETVP